MKPNHEVIKKLLTKHIEVCESINRLAEEGVQVNALDCLELFDVAMDLIGFPPDTTLDSFCTSMPQVTPETPTKENFSREHWDMLSLELTVDNLDVFIEKLHTDCEELRASYPHLFAEN